MSAGSKVAWGTYGWLTHLCPHLQGIDVKVDNQTIDLVDSYRDISLGLYIERDGLFIRATWQKLGYSVLWDGGE